MRFLSQLNPRRFHSANQVWRLDGGNEDNWLYGLTDVTNDEVIGEVLSVTSVFVPTDEQRKQIAEGANIALTCLTIQPPVMMCLTDEPIGKPPDNDPWEYD